MSADDVKVKVLHTYFGDGDEFDIDGKLIKMLETCVRDNTATVIEGVLTVAALTSWIIACYMAHEKEEAHKNIDELAKISKELVDTMIDAKVWENRKEKEPGKRVLN